MIYCVEDDRNIRELIIYTLETTGFRACGFCDGSEFFKELDVQRKCNELPELVLLDVMLPGEDGIQILKRLRSSATTKNIPVIMVTAKGAEYDKVIGLDCGADDYITKPFGMMEFVSRIKALLRRTGNSVEKEQEFSVGNLMVNVEKHLVTVNGNEISLTYKEFEVLKVLMMNRGIVLTRDKLLEMVWGYDFDGETRTVDVHIRTLRQKLEECGDLIQTVRGVGYRIGNNN
ncbi:two-component system, OmpR family, alkaline phosphatase synthesis response regulator PhoP [Hathewaya proteolytica DSM 3090]|uniref:Stage 0 sporulation protein A homolog n=1 Tax=Hathewaya proteolytica DSM 3090 TaxID=1121331 RepID=A0A1M6PV95_9CLOT|nr:response regulator transcription factor [Hathewaya proteolytica]SHK11894.1 two-component system, OmpR family, alkaline phosphatase synthesis response regulator PhoP [Hathewaya proteolytica DSM 3090]